MLYKVLYVFMSYLYVIVYLYEASRRIFFWIFGFLRFFLNFCGDFFIEVIAVETWGSWFCVDCVAGHLPKIMFA